MQLTTETVEQSLTTPQRALLVYIAGHPGATKKEAARATAFGQGEHTVRERMRTIDSLIRRGLVRAAGRQRKGDWAPWHLTVTAKGRRWVEALVA